MGKFGRPVKIDMGQFFSTISYQDAVLINKFHPAFAAFILPPDKKQAYISYFISL
ncbi:hypothetical protein [Kalamiella sp. sgz302252]|uniref:hypothetical protein n=1 Tax=Pantoea sp. sgz302252 TaxID=3341827 RepID=UPI0036D3A52B